MENQQPTRSNASEAGPEPTENVRTTRDKTTHPHHVAIIRPNYADLILLGLKTIESRLAKSRVPPFAAVHQGQTILFKLVAGPYACSATVQHVQYHENLNPATIDNIRETYNNHILGDDKYWNLKRETARYATLIWLTDPRPITKGPPLPKLHGQGWVKLPKSKNNTNPQP